MKIRNIGTLSKGVVPSSSTATYVRPSALNGAVSRFNPSVSRGQLSSRSLTYARPSTTAIPNRAARYQPRIGIRNASSSSEEAKPTQLYDLHVARGGKMAPYAGYSMPLYYSDQSHLESHKWTREKSSLFDVSHM